LVDCLDVEKSEVVYSDNKIMAVRRYSLIENKMPVAVSCFKIPQYPVKTFIRNDVVQLIERSPLTGFETREFNKNEWDHVLNIK